MSTSKKYGNWALIAVAMLLFGTAIATIQFKVPVVMGDIMANMDMDASSASWLMSIFTFVGIVLALPTGALAKKFGPKTMLLAAAAIIAAGSLLGAFAGNGMVLIVSRAIEGVAFIFVTICGPLAVQKYVAPDKIGSATGIWALWVCLGSVVGGVLTPTLYASTGFVGVWVIYAAAAVVFAIVVAVIVKAPGEALEEAADACRRGEGRLRRAREAQHPAVLRRLPRLQHDADGGAELRPHLHAAAGRRPDAVRLRQHASHAARRHIVPAVRRLVRQAGPLQAAVPGRDARHGPLHADPAHPDRSLMWVGAIVMGLVGLGGPVMCLTSYINVLGRPELMSIGMGVLMLIQSLGQFLGTWLVPLLLGPDVSAWMFTGIVMCVIGFAGTAALALCKFK
ncbi:MAG: MFS transporter [Gordonibacter pamelaeae]